MSLDDDRIEKALVRILEKRGADAAVSVEAIVAENPDIEGPLRARLRVLRMLEALRDPKSPSCAGSGVFESLSQMGKGIRPLSLPDSIGDEQAPVVIPQTPSGRWGRYAVVGEIARGGVGVVLKARDPDLGRDVALKILREDHASSPDVLQRFVEEAQVGGQLQHPGIVPVYELGLGSDGQPYFVMKLVKGKTLAKLLAERATPSLDRPRFLSVFQAVCQTVAYAHERRIVHRDLKPSNVMVGAFGEVQVLDWGMAKVLARGGAADDARTTGEDPHALVRTVRSASGSAPSVEGSVLGTPQYMAPEQARGEMDRLDERADVFSLGAILCEVLTGQPPYTGTDREILSAAAEARLDPAHERLRSCGADAELIALATRCLAPDKADRPRDAGVLARDLTGYLASLAERVRRAEVEAGESRVLVEQERKARRLTLSLSAAVVAFLLLGGGGWLWIDHQRRERADAAGRQVTQALDEASRLRGQAEAAGSEEALPLWREALATVGRAQALAETDADAETKQRVGALMSGIVNGQRQAQAAAQQRRRDDDAAARLDEIRALAGETWNWKAASAAYADAFRRYFGSDLESVGIDEAARRIDASRIRDQLILALMFWARARDAAREGLTLLPQLVARVDANSWRAKVRRAAADLRALQALAGEANLDALDAQDVVYLAGRLGAEGDPDRAAALALEVWRRHPADFWACFTCAEWTQRCSPPRFQEALRFYTAALAIRPRSVAVRVNIGSLLKQQGEIDAAIAEFREAVRLDPNFATARGGLGWAVRAKGDLDGAIAQYREAIRLDPALAIAHSDLADVLTDKGDMDGAMREHREALRLDPQSARVHHNFGALLARRGDVDGAIAEYREAIRLDPRLAMAHSNLGVNLEAKGDLDGAILEHREALRLDGKSAISHSNFGVTLLANGDVDGAIAEYREAIRLDPRFALAHANLGKALIGKGDVDGAIAAYREAIRLDPRNAITHDNLGGALAEKGDLDGAIAEYHEAIRLDPRDAFPHDNLARTLTRKGDLDGAIAEYHKAIRLDPRDAIPHDDLAQALRRRGDLDGAIAECREAIRLDPRLPEPHLTLGLVLRTRGQLRESLESFRRAAELAPAHQVWAYSPGQAVKDTERLIAAADLLAPFSRGETDLATSQVALDVARAGYNVAAYAASARAWNRTFAIDPSLADNLKSGHRYNAACAAALAGTAKGTDAATLDAAARARWQRQALEWLRADLDAWKRESDPKIVGSMLEHWKQDTDLAGIRDESELAKLTAEDQKLCRALWRDVDESLSKAPNGK